MLKTHMAAANWVSSPGLNRQNM